MTTTAGSLALEGSIAPADAVRRRAPARAPAPSCSARRTCPSGPTSARRTRPPAGADAAASAAIPTPSTAIPRDRARGSGAAVAASFAAAAVGIRDGRLDRLALEQLRLVGIKPTVGLVSRTGIIPIAHSQDTAGPMARTVADAAALLDRDGGIGPDRRRDARRAPERRRRLHHASSIRRGCKGARIGVPRKGLFGQSPAADRVVEAAIAALKAAGRGHRRSRRHRDRSTTSATASSRSCSTSSRRT